MPLPELTLIGHQSIALELYEYLGRAILNGALRPNERLVEQAVAEFYGVSRTPVREALRRLAGDGLVDDTSRGLIVKEFSVEEFADMCAVREVLEGMAARQAATLRSDVDLIAMQQIIEALEDATISRNLSLMIELSLALHETVDEAARNKYLSKQLRHVRSFINRFQESTLGDPLIQRHALDEHRALVDAIVAQDPDCAEQVATKHFRQIALIRLTSRRLEGRLSRAAEAPGDDAYSA
jgi:DNA-binding GntR family transcriptional regulator